jgi:hypothetical protein
MVWIQPFLVAPHLIGLALGMGCATAKLALLVKCKSHSDFLPTYLAASKIITRLIVAGTILLVISGIGWLLLGYPMKTRLFIKLVLVGAILVLGPIIDNVAEPKFRRLAPQPGQSASTAFLDAQRTFLLLETVATGLFYVIIVLWLWT